MTGRYIARWPQGRVDLPASYLRRDGVTGAGSLPRAGSWITCGTLDLASIRSISAAARSVTRAADTHQRNVPMFPYDRAQHREGDHVITADGNDLTVAA